MISPLLKKLLKELHQLHAQLEETGARTHHEDLAAKLQEHVKVFVNDIQLLQLLQQSQPQRLKKLKRSQLVARLKPTMQSIKDVITFMDADPHAVPDRYHLIIPPPPVEQTILSDTDYMEVNPPAPVDERTGLLK